MVGGSKNSRAQVIYSNSASTSLRKNVGCQNQHPCLRFQSKKSEPTPSLREDPPVSTHPPSTGIDRPSSPIVVNLDIKTTAKRKGRGPTTNPKAKKRKEGNKGEVKISKRLSRAVGGEELTEFITEMGVVLRQYAPLNVTKWVEVPMHYKDKMWDDLMTMSVRNKANRAKQSTSTICGRKSFASVLYDMRNPKTEVDPDLIEYWKATHQRRTDDTWCSDKAKNDMNQLEHVRKSQDELGDPPLSTEEYLTQAFGARSGYLRGLGCGPRPLSIKNLEAKASQEAFERQIEELKNQLKDENEEREARLQREKDERDERFKKEIEKIKGELKAEFNEQLKIIIELYGVPSTSSPPSTQNH